MSKFSAEKELKKINGFQDILGKTHKINITNQETKFLFVSISPNGLFKLYIFANTKHTLDFIRIANILNFNHKKDQ